MSELDSEFEEKEIEWERRVSDMRERLKTRLDENTIEGKREDNLYHGMKLVSSIMMIGTFKEISYCEETQEYLVIDLPSKNMLRYSVEGKLIQPSYSLGGNMLFTKVLWCQKAKVLIGYLPNDDVIWLMTSFCMLYQIFRNDFRIIDVFYEPDTNEAILAGPNKVTRFSLTNKESTINTWKTMSYIDSEYGTLWKLECLALIPSSTSILRMAGSYMTTLYVLPLETSKEKEEAVPIMFLARNPGATEAQITALLFQIDSQWIITGDEQGNVKGWDLELNCTMNCPGGHSRCVKKIVSHPSICGFITFSEDNILQIWSCNLREKMESFSDIGEIWGIAINESAAAIATLGQKLSCFNMHQLYTFYAALSDSATEIISTMNPMYSTRVIVRSSDNSIRILTSTTGKQISLQILPENLNLVSMAYSGNRERLYTIILKTGEILVSNSKMNPMELKHVWVPGESVITCITAYEYYEEIRGCDLKPQNPRVIYSKYTLIFVGTKEGDILNIDESSGKHEGKFAAHKGPVTKLYSSTISKLVVSVGVDKCVKVWRVHANLGVPLALAHSVYYTVPITHVVTMGSNLCMASSTARVSIHQLFMYDMIETVRLDHHRSKDHKKLILDIAGSESLQICATSSMDNTIKVWDKQNILIKVLEINTSARNIVFSSLRGDIVFGAGRHLYKISYRNCKNNLCKYYKIINDKKNFAVQGIFAFYEDGLYSTFQIFLDLAPKYRARILLDEIPDEIEENILPENEEYRIYDTEVNRELLLHPVSSVPLGSLDTKDGDAPRLELMIQEQMCDQLERRDQDIENIKNGEIKTVKLVSDKSLMNREAWEKYMADITSVSNKPGIEIRESQDTTAMIKKFKNVKRFYNKPGVFKMLYGYSIEKFPEYPETVPDSVKHPNGIPLFGFLPNSVIYKLFNNDEDVEPALSIPEQKPLLKYEYPQEFLMNQLREKSSSRFDSNVEISPSQLLNMTNIKGVESDTIVLRANIQDTDNNPFVKMTRNDFQREQRSYKKMKNQREKFQQKSLSSVSKKLGGNFKLFRKKKLLNKSKKSGSNMKLKIARRSRKTRGSPRKQILSTSKTISEETLQRGLKDAFTNLDDLVKMKIKNLKTQKTRIKEVLKNDYGFISRIHDDKIKQTLTILLTRFMNTPSPFSVILNFLNVLPIDDIEIVGSLCTIFTVTSKRMIRNSIMKYLENRGLKDPEKVLTKQLLVVKSLTNISDIFEMKKFISAMISDWIKTFEKHVILVSDEFMRNGKNLKSMKRFLQKDASIQQDFSSVNLKNGFQQPIISPIEGINYFCELSKKSFQFSKILEEKLESILSKYLMKKDSNHDRKRIKLTILRQVFENNIHLTIIKRILKTLRHPTMGNNASNNE